MYKAWLRSSLEILFCIGASVLDLNEMGLVLIYISIRDGDGQNQEDRREEENKEEEQTEEEEEEVEKKKRAYL